MLRNLGFINKKYFFHMPHYYIFAKSRKQKTKNQY